MCSFWTPKWSPFWGHFRVIFGTPILRGFEKAQEGSKRPQEGPGRAPRRAQDHPRGPQEGSKRAQEGLKTALEGHKSAQEGFKTAQEGHKRALRGPKKAARQCQTVPDDSKTASALPRMVKIASRRSKKAQRVPVSVSKQALDGVGGFKTFQDNYKRTTQDGFRQPRTPAKWW
jgi:hypothetical protein